MVITWKKFIFGVMVGIAVLIFLSVMKGEPVFSSKNIAIILGVLTFYIVLFLWRYWRNNNHHLFK
jgi:multisubunit Na+/H+ antiporter MnhE subunit